jgi:hypothetical protein
LRHLGAYRTAFNQPKAVIGRQEDRIGDTRPQISHACLGS